MDADDFYWYYDDDDDCEDIWDYDVYSDHLVYGPFDFVGGGGRGIGVVDDGEDEVFGPPMLWREEDGEENDDLDPGLFGWGDGEDEENEEEEYPNENPVDAESVIAGLLNPPPPRPLFPAPISPVDPPGFSMPSFSPQNYPGERGGQRQSGLIDRRFIRGTDQSINRRPSSPEAALGLVDTAVPGGTAVAEGATGSDTLAATDSSDSGTSGGPICPICFDRWTSQGQHSLCCLPCGHLYGFSCIDKWLRRPNAQKLCPQCNKECSLKDVRKLYGAQVALTVDEELQQKILDLEKRCASLELKDAEWARKEAEWQEKEADLHKQLNQQKGCS